MCRCPLRSLRLRSGRVVCSSLSGNESLYQWWARHRGSAAVRGPLSLGRQQPASAPRRQINSSRKIITFRTQAFSEVRATAPQREDEEGISVLTLQSQKHYCIRYLPVYFYQLVSVCVSGPRPERLEAAL